MRQRWRQATQAALYGPGGFFVSTAAAGPAAHFRTSVHASPLFAGALLELIRRIDTTLERPDSLDVVDVGAGRGELLLSLLEHADPDLAGRLRPVAVELAPRPDALPAGIEWRADPPDQVHGVLLATEWLDNVPVDIAEATAGGVRYVEVEADGTEADGAPVTGADAGWLARWWPLGGASPGTRAEIGGPRDAAWAAAVGRVRRGLAIAVDYGHLSGSRPPLGTLAAYRGGRQVTPVPDGSCDITAHVAMDAVATTGSAVAGGAPYTLLTQRAALHALGVTGRRPPLELAHTDPARYLRSLVAASAAAELTDPAGLGGHYWLLQPVGIDTAPLPAPGTGPGPR